jgi:glycine cleavage system H protein
MNIKYTPEHEWIDVSDPAAATVGITVHAQDALGDVESVKAAADLYMPVTGEIIEVNEALRADPALANSDPLASGWFFKVKVAHRAELDGLMDATAYDALLKTL